MYGLSRGDRTRRAGYGTLLVMGNFLSRLLAAAPDLVTSAVYLTAWLAPAIAGPQYVNDLVLAMLMAAFVVFVGVLYAQLVKSSSSRISNLFALTVMSAVVLLILINVLNENAPGADHSGPSRIELAIDRPAQLVPFAWIYASQFFHLLARPAQSSAEEGARMETLSTFSVAAYVSSFVAAIALPLRPFGITPEFVTTMQRGEGDMWGIHVYIPLAFGVFYFALQACIKYALTGPASRPAK